MYVLLFKNVFVCNHVIIMYIPVYIVLIVCIYVSCDDCSFSCINVYNKSITIQDFSIVIINKFVLLAIRCISPYVNFLIVVSKLLIISKVSVHRTGAAWPWLTENTTVCVIKRYNGGSNYDSLIVRTVAFPVQVAYWI